MIQPIALLGTGLAGMVQALALAQQDFPVTLIGPVPEAKKDGRTTAVLQPGIDFLKKLGLWEAIAPTATPLMTMELIDGSHHSIFDAAEIDQMLFGYNISNAALKDILVKNLKKDKRITWHDTLAKNVTRSNAGWKITLQNNKTIECDLLIGADGRDSLTRQAANIPAQEKDPGQTALVTILKCEKPHFNTTVEYYRKGGPLTLVPMQKNRFAVVWCGTTEDQKAKILESKTDIENELTTFTQNRFGALKLDAPLQPWPVRPMQAHSMIAAHCALIGEAAHVIPPIGAQGFNSSLHDINTLTRVLTQGRAIGYAPSDITLLKEYEKIRFPEILLRCKTVNVLNKSLLSGNPLLHRMRHLSFFGMHRIPFMKKYVMHTGLRQAS